MPAKLKPSTKEYIKVNNKMTNRFFIKHHTVSSTSTEELIKLYESDSYNRGASDTTIRAKQWMPDV